MRAVLPVDVQTDIEIARPREEVAAYVSDPSNTTAWYEREPRRPRAHQADSRGVEPLTRHRAKAALPLQ